MEFGRGTYEGLVKENFVLPPTSQTTLTGERAKQTNIYVGLDKWGRTEWLGKFYPLKTKEKEFLDYYVKHFNSIEFSATHYKLYDKEAIEKWVNKVARIDFKFCPKMYQEITHRGSLKGKDWLTGEFFKSISAFGEYLGPVFIQLSQVFSNKRKDELYDFLKTLPPTHKYFLEVRHESWFSSEQFFQDFEKKLISLNIGLVITDTIGRRDVLHMRLSTKDTFVRFGCEGNSEMDKFRIKQWKSQLEEWFDKGLENCYFFLHPHDHKEVPDFAKYVQEQLTNK